MSAEVIRAMCIVNPRAGGRHSSLNGLPTVLDQLRASGFSLEVRETGAEGPTSAELANEAVRGGYEACVVAGGDGTVQPAATALLDTGVVLGILPYGSFMNIANGLGIPLKAEQAARIIAAKHVVKCDVGAIGKRIFYETAGIGVDADLFGAARLAEQGKHRRAIRRLWRVATRSTHQVDIVVDGRAHRHRVFQILVANSPFYLWSLLVAPKATMDDGQLEVAVYERMGRLRLFATLVNLWRTGEYPTPPATYRGRTIELRSATHLPVHADGELAGTLPVTIRCRPGALAVYAPTRN